MDINLFALTRKYSQAVDDFVQQAKKDMCTDIDWDFYSQTHYTEEHWKLLDNFEQIGREAAEKQAQFMFLCPDNGDVLTGKVIGCSREDKLLVIFHLQLDDLPDANIVFQCTIQESLKLSESDKVIAFNTDTVPLPLGGVVPPSSLTICL
jgi:hypothetical protein